MDEDKDNEMIDKLRSMRAYQQREEITPLDVVDRRLRSIAGKIDDMIARGDLNTQQIVGAIEALGVQLHNDMLSLGSMLRSRSR